MALQLRGLLASAQTYHPRSKPLVDYAGAALRDECVVVAIPRRAATVFERLSNTPGGPSLGRVEDVDSGTSSAPSSRGGGGASSTRNAAEQISRLSAKAKDSGAEGVLNSGAEGVDSGAEGVLNSGAEGVLNLGVEGVNSGAEGVDSGSSEWRGGQRGGVEGLSCACSFWLNCCNTGDRVASST
eukprot:1177705-Prorocentrum_minimum.AAC.4